MRAIAVAVVFALISAAPACAEPDDRATALRAINAYAAPASAAFMETAAHHEQDWRALCAKRSKAALARAQASFRQTADAWARMELLRIGPAGEDFRAERVNFWPDRRNATTRGLADLIDAKTPPTAQAIRAASAAVQGLPALERLLFDKGGATLVGASGGKICAVGQAISGNLAALAQEINAGWGPVRAALDQGPQARETVARFATDLLTEFQSLIDSKLSPALGKDSETARPNALEGWRANRARESFIEPLKGVEALARALIERPDEAQTLFATLATARAIAEDLPADFPAVLADPKRRFQAVLLRDALRAAQDVANRDLPELIGVTVGFNSRDGD